MTDQTDTDATALAVKLLPCPFCSGPATAWETEGGEMCPSVWCRNSVSCGGQVCIEDASRDAIAAWNTRPPAAPAPSNLHKTQIAPAAPATGEVEKVARAIAAVSTRYLGPKEGRTLEQRVDEEWQDYEFEAEAAIRALNGGS